MTHYVSEQVVAEALELSCDPYIQNLFGDKTTKTASDLAGILEAFRSPMRKGDLRQLQSETHEVVVKLTSERE